MAKRTLIVGCVIKGKGEGRTIGYPTANLDSRTLRGKIPHKGVWAAWAALPSKIRPRVSQIELKRFTRALPAILIIGVEGKTEVYYLNRRVRCYGKYISVMALKKIRNVRSYSSNSALVRAIKRDIKDAKRYINKVNLRAYSL